MTSRPVLFLDVDGVLNDEPYMRSRGWRGVYGMIDREKVMLLNEIVAATGCLIVLSSAWRSDTRFRSSFRRRGAKLRFHRQWRTGRICDPEPNLRGREIADWLERNGSPVYAIVDDDSDMLPEQWERFVQTSFQTGLTRECADRIIALLSAADMIRRAKAAGIKVVEVCPASSPIAPERGNVGMEG